MLTTDTCFNSQEFTRFWEDVTDAAEKAASNAWASPSFCWDDGWELDLLVELFNEGCPVPDAVNEMLEADGEAAFDAAMSIPVWDR